MHLRPARQLGPQFSVRQGSPGEPGVRSLKIDEIRGESAQTQGDRGKRQWVGRVSRREGQPHERHGRHDAGDRYRRVVSVESRSHILVHPEKVFRREPPPDGHEDGAFGPEGLVIRPNRY